MVRVRTVTGDVAPEELGVCDMGEHVLHGVPGWDHAPEARAYLPRPEAFEGVQTLLTEYLAAGGAAVVDLVGIGMGRDPQFSADVSRESGVRIVGCTGFGDESEMLTYFRTSIESIKTATKPGVLSRDVDYLADILTSELEHGMGTSGIPAGAITVGAGTEEFTELEQLVHRAAARVSVRTGAAIFTTSARYAERQVEILLEEKADPERVVLGPVDDGDHGVDRDLELAGRGFNVRFGNVGHAPGGGSASDADADRARRLLHLVEAGHGDRVVVGCGGDGWRMARDEDGTRAAPRHLLDGFSAILAEQGVTEEQLHRVLVSTPARILAH